ncbi:MAG TPA: hypothetical protein VJQ54_23795 [Candidatus Sulfotelmatobacter sp.]|nr:hypothetical protein [Candidatus Sulfotelmatobacter sp.]
MRFYEGDYAYEIERIRDSATQVFTGWRYNVYRIRPDQKLLRSGDVQSQEEAEASARRELASVIKGEVTTRGAEGGRAA